MADPCDPILDASSNGEELDLGQDPAFQAVFIAQPVEGDEGRISDGFDGGGQDALPAVVCGDGIHQRCGAVEYMDRVME